MFQSQFSYLLFIAQDIIDHFIKLFILNWDIVTYNSWHSQPSFALEDLDEKQLLFSEGEKGKMKKGEKVEII